MHTKFLILLLCVLGFTRCQTSNSKPNTEGVKPTFEFGVIEYDMPFSASTPDSATGLSGFYVALGEAVANDLGMVAKPSFIMSAFQSRPIRDGLLAGKCVAQIGLPRTDGKWLIPRKVQLTESFASMGYSLVIPQDSKITKASDLKGKMVAVQTGSPAHMGLDRIGGVKLSYSLFAEPAMVTLAEGKADAAIIWGATAGYQNKYLYNNRFKVIPTNYTWPVAIALTAANDSLTRQVDAALVRLKPTIDQLYTKYGFPKGAVFMMPELPSTEEDKEEKDTAIK